MKRKIDVLFIFISVVIGLLLGVVLEFLHDAIVPEFDSKIPVVLLYLTAFAIIFGVVLLFKGLIGEAFVKLGKVMLFTLIGLIAFMGCTVLFEYLYELEFAQTKTLKGDDIQYVFIIDDSGSMREDTFYNDGENDPDGVRFDAVGEIIRNMEPTDRFAVYAFSNSTVCITPFGSENSEDYEITDKEPTQGGGTMLIDSIQQAINDVCDDESIHTKIIVLTDGDPQDMNLYNRMVGNCKDENVSVSSVGFGDAKESFLKRLAEDTGGIFVVDQNLDVLTDNLETLVKAKIPAGQANRYLTGYRADSTHDSFLYAFLRVLFLTLLGAVWTIIKMLLVGEKKFMRMSAVLSGVFCALGALLCEVMMLFGMSDSLARIIFCMLWACTIIPSETLQRINLNNTLHTGRSNVGGTIADDFASKSNGGGDSKSFL